MPIRIQYKATCDNCNIVILDKELSPGELEDGVDLGEKVIFTRREELELVFHSDACCYQWLKSKGHHSEAEEFMSTPWT
jgi:hypothetical protein